jgi:hypothetical protein
VQHGSRGGDEVFESIGNVNWVSFTRRENRASQQSISDRAPHAIAFDLIGKTHVDFDERLLQGRRYLCTLERVSDLVPANCLSRPVVLSMGSIQQMVLKIWGFRKD